ncbi:hypothetical protein GGR56DRAFT_674787 [Xylariaceae sp. FL0804]|nr:hypothetical protein GGR56DRAFT_674787 [Xylariaceae sp. FL0804]
MSSSSAAPQTVRPSGLVYMLVGTLAAALTALRPILKKLPFFSSVGSYNNINNNSGSKGGGVPLRTFGRGSRSRGDLGPAYKLDDTTADCSPTNSQQNIFRADNKPAIHKSTAVDITYGQNTGPTARDVTRQRRGQGW